LFKLVFFIYLYKVHIIQHTIIHSNSSQGGLKNLYIKSNWYKFKILQVQADCSKLESQYFNSLYSFNIVKICDYLNDVGCQ